MTRACDELGVSERRACRVLNQARSTQRHRVPVSDETARLKRVVADLTLDKHMLSEALRKEV